MATTEGQTAADAPIDDDRGGPDDEELPFRYSITAWGVDYPVDSLVKRLNDDAIYVPPFQRDYVWSQTDASKFVESLLLGLPVPGIFLSRDEKTGRLLVIDGQQRLKSLQFFYNGIFADTGREFALRGVSKFHGVTYRSLDVEDRRRLDDSLLHATVVKQDDPSNDESSIYLIFERLNTGGKTLSPQEIRACIFHGSFNSLLKELNEDENWRAIFGARDARMRDQEMILRFLAFANDGGGYSKPLKGFLNDFMGAHRDISPADAEPLAESFRGTIALVRTAIGGRAFRPRRNINAAVVESVMVGLDRRLSTGPVRNESEVRDAYDSLVADKVFLQATETGTADERAVSSRLTLATQAFKDVR